MAKILIANKFYYPRGGDCIYTINLAQLLKGHGHDVAIFAMQHPETISTSWKKYFPKEVKFELGPNIFDAIMRPFGAKEVIKKFNALLDDFKPDIVHLNNIHSQLSPVIAKLAHKRGVKVIWTIHDYKLLCPRYDCLRNGETICEDCFTDKHKVLYYKCMKKSLFASYLSYKEADKWSRERLESYTDMFICPSLFMANKMKQGAFNNNKLKTIHNFIDTTKCNRDNYTQKENYYCFIGRLSYEKGIKTLIEAANNLPYQLVIIGGGVLEKELKAIASSHITFVGIKQWEQIKELVGKARFTVIPSEWYEVFGLVIIESLCLGTPVLGANIGGIPELIENGVNGMIFESKNKTELKNKIEMMWNAHFDYESIAQKAQQKYNAERYYQELVNNIYKLSI